MTRHIVFSAALALLATVSMTALAQDRASAGPQTGGVANGVADSAPRPWASLHSVVTPGDNAGAGILGAPINLRPGGFVAPIAREQGDTGGTGNIVDVGEPAATSVQAYNDTQAVRSNPQAAASYDASWVGQGLGGQRLDTSASAYNQRLFDSRQSDANRRRALIPSPFPAGFGE